MILTWCFIVKLILNDLKKKRRNSGFYNYQHVIISFIVPIRFLKNFLKTL